MDHLLKTFFDRLENAAPFSNFRDAMAAMAAGFDLPAFAYIAFAKQYQLCAPIILRA